MTHHLRLRSLLVVGFITVLAACGGGGSTSNPPPVPQSTVTPGSTPTPGATATPTPAATATPTPAATATPGSGALAVKTWHSFSHFQPNTIDVYTTATPPPGVVGAPTPGDLIVVAFWNNGQDNGSSNTYTPPDNTWTVTDSNTTGHFMTYELFTHVAAAGEPYPYIFTPQSPVRFHVYISADIANASPVIDGAQNVKIDPASATYTTPTLTPTKSNDMAIAFQLPVIGGPAVSIPWSNDPSWTVGLPDSWSWNGETLTKMLSDTSPVSETSTLGQAEDGFSTIMLVTPANP